MLSVRRITTIAATSLACGAASALISTAPASAAGWVIDYFPTKQSCIDAGTARYGAQTNPIISGWGCGITPSPKDPNDAWLLWFDPGFQD